MMEEKKPGIDTSAKPSAPSATDTTKEGDQKVQPEVVPKKQYEELESKYGEVNSFFEEISPLLDKLDKQPELVRAILDDKITGDLAKAVLEGKVNPQDATIVAKAHEEVKKELGKDYKTANPQDIEKLISDKLNQLEKNVTERLDQDKEIRDYESEVNNFINTTSDFADYADGISKWFDEHPDQFDIKIAYDAVKGVVMGEKVKELNREGANEEAKNLAANTGGSSSKSSSVIKDKKVIDELISGPTNPNVF